MTQNEPAVGQDPLIGALIADRYQILAPLARGGMGRVYRALQVQLGREVAVKVLDAARDVDESLRADFTRRFMLEASSLAKLNHPNTTVIHDYGEAGDGCFFIAMELLTGQTLRELISAEGRLDFERSIRIGVSIASSLAEAHDVGLIHRDLKPANIVLTRRGDDHEFVKVLDFGLVKLENADNGDLSSTGHMVGTPRYMAPEQILGGGVSPATDVYGLGATLYHMLVGQPPFDGNSRFELLVKQTDERPAPLTAVAPDAGISLSLEAVVLRCLEKKPEKRYPDMRAVAAALVDCSSFSGSWPMGLSPSLSISAAARAARADTTQMSGDHSDNLGSTKIGKRGNSSVSGVKPMQRSEEPVQPATAASSFVAPEPSASVALPAAGPAPGSSTRGLVAVAVGALLLSVVAVSFVLVSSLRDGSTPEASDTSHTVQVAEPPATTPDPPLPVAVPPTTRADAPLAEAPPADTRVRLTTDPAGAHVRRGERDLGDTPLTLVVPEGETWTVELSLQGYEVRTITVLGGQEQLQVGLSRRRGRVRGNPPPDRDVGGRTDNRDPWADER